MSTRVVERVDDWDQRSFAGGYGALSDLADEDFSGVVRAGGAELYMTLGTPVAVRQGTIEDFESASGTAYEAPAAALPLLAVMQEADADVRAEYYTEETPISEVDATLSDGGFTGYVELSENVLSGDYYLVYHGGNAMTVAFVGSSSRLLTDDEAYETADDEVGIYKVRQVDVEAIDIPEPTDGGANAAAVAEAPADAEAVDDDAADADADGSAETGDDAAETADEDTPTETDDAQADADDASAGDPSSESGADASDPDAQRPGDGEAGSAASAGTTEETAGTGTSSGPTDDAPAASTAETREEVSGSGTPAGPDAGAGATTQSRASEAGGGQQRAGGGRTGRSGGEPTGRDGRSPAPVGRGNAEAGDLETRAVPSLDPDQTEIRQRTQSATPAGGREGRAARDAPAGGGRPSGERREPSGSSGETKGAAAASEEVGTLEEAIAEREERIEELEADLAAAENERVELESELESVREERDELRGEVDRLEEELERIEEELGAATDAERRMSPAEAIDGTNLFVDYDSKGSGTLEKAHGGAGERDDVRENLQVGIHTEFDQDAASVAGEAFGTFLEGTLQYRFASWLLGDLLFEIRDTGHREALTDLYDAIPEIRRVEFDGVVDVEYVEDGQEQTATEGFDVIFRHRMGDPLVVANLNDSRDPATGPMMESLITSAERVGQTEDSLSAAFLVTSSFFESEALETVGEATKGGLLSRDSRTSFVNLSRKTGYHLCLVANRGGNFSMEVPEL